jgi:hypothetical protein
MKDVPYLIFHKSIFYLEFFEFRKVSFRPLQIQVSLKILFTSKKAPFNGPASVCAT